LLNPISAVKDNVRFEKDILTHDDVSQDIRERGYFCPLIFLSYPLARYGVSAVELQLAFLPRRLAPTPREKCRLFS